MIDYVAHLRREGASLIDAAMAAPDAAVVHCPGWHNARIATHVGRIYASMAAQLRSGSQEPAMGEPAPLPGDDEDLRIWFDGHLGQLVAALEATNPAQALWTWIDRQEAGFYHRRVAHETAVHRWDAERSTGTQQPIDDELALDGIDEVLAVGLQQRRSGDPVVFPSGTMHLHRTDGPGEWLVVPGDGRLTVTNEHAKGDIAVRGTASELLLYLWGRDEGAVETFGDPALVTAWSSVAP
jgi:uncharacterized protein (TIGR03083 family)